MKAKFWRKLRTEDAAGEDLDFGADNCFRFLFPVAGGRFEQSDNVTVPVADSLYASDSEVCVRKCGGKETTRKDSKSTKSSGIVAGSSGIERTKGMDKIATNWSIWFLAKSAEPTSCDQEYRWPEGCRDTDCEYRARWAWDGAGQDTVQFNISAKGIGRWTGIGFSRDGRMAGADIVTGWVYDQKVVRIERTNDPK